MIYVENLLVGSCKRDLGIMLKGPHFVLAHLKKKDQKNVSWHESKTGINNQGIDDGKNEKRMMVTLLPLTQVPFELLSLKQGIKRPIRKT